MTTIQSASAQAIIDEANRQAKAAIPASKPVTPKAVKAASTPKAAKPVKAKAAPKAVKAKATHKPSTIKRTEDNPARSLVPVRYKQAYAEHNDTNGSALSLALKKATTTTNSDGREVLDIPALKAIAKAHGIDFSKYEDLNNGQKRMNVGNRLRGLVKAGKPVTIGGKAFKTDAAVASKATVEQAAA